MLKLIILTIITHVIDAYRDVESIQSLSLTHSILWHLLKLPQYLAWLWLGQALTIRMGQGRFILNKYWQLLFDVIVILVIGWVTFRLALFYFINTLA